MAYPMYGNNNQYYMQSLQDMKNNIEEQMRRYQQNQMQMQQPVPQPQIHQSFQLAPQSNAFEIQAKYVTDITDVQNTFVMNLGIFVNKELDTLWLKNINGEIRTFALSEIIQEDPKDKEINNLKQELENMKLLVSENKVKEEKEDMPRVSTKNTKK